MKRAFTIIYVLILVLFIGGMVLIGCQEKEGTLYMDKETEKTEDQHTRHSPAQSAGNAAERPGVKYYEDAEAARLGYMKATFAAGCFWGVEEMFRKIPGVVSTCVGYTGGRLENPTYKQVCSDRTGHAEAVQVVYDPAKVKYEQLLDIFWHGHNPTTRNRQGPDVGSQYRSGIFYHSLGQKEKAEESKAALAASGAYSREIVTEIVPAEPFYVAEDYHQQYLEKRGQSSCHF